MKNKIKKNRQAQLYNLLNETEVLDEKDRLFWLENLSNLNRLEQEKLWEIISQANQELQKEMEGHTRRLSEITTKYELKLKFFSEKNSAHLTQSKLQANFNEPVHDTELLTALHEAGEL